MADLHAHLFPGDRDEHGAVIAASIVNTSRGKRLLAQRVFLAKDGIDYVPGQRGYRMLTAAFVMDCALHCASEGLAYLAAHCHGGSTSVAFSDVDLKSHDRGYPALRDILDGPPVGGLVFAENAVAGDIWFADGTRESLDLATVAGRPIEELRAQPLDRSSTTPKMYDRQARLFGDRGQEILSRQKVGVIGAGGAGSLVIEQLARLGVGELVVVDPDRIESSNLPRVVGSRRRDLRPLIAWITSRPLGRRVRPTSRHKVDIAKRHARESNRRTSVQVTARSVVAADVAERLIDCDYLVLAADSMQARLVFNALVHQYVIPGAQMGVKAQVKPGSGEITDLFVVYRPLVPGEGCLWCNGLIPPARLQEEAIEPDERRRQRYVEDDDVPAPSVITLNGIAASLTTSGYLMAVTGLLQGRALAWSRHDPRANEFIEEKPRRSGACPECSEDGRLGRGPTRRLPVAVE